MPNDIGRAISSPLDSVRPRRPQQRVVVTVPQAPEIEAAALGCVSLAALNDDDQRNARLILRQLSRSLFFDVRNQEIFEAFRALDKAGMALDTITLTRWLNDKGRINDAGGLAYVAGLPEQTASQFTFDTHLETLKDKQKRRQLLELAERAKELVQDQSVDPGLLVSEFTEMGKSAARNGAPRRQWVKFNKPSQCREWQAPLDWVLVGENHITRGDMTVVAGPPGCGKSRALMWLALCGARGEGQRWFGREVHSKFKTMIIQAENGPYRLKQDFDELKSRELESALLVTEPPQYGFQFSDAEFREFVAEKIREFEPGVIGFDPWNRIVSDDSARDFVEGLENLRATIALAQLAKEPAIVIVHHFKKGDGSERISVRSQMDRLSGSYTLGAGARCVFGMLNASDDEEEDRIVFTCAKNNNGKLGERTAWHRIGNIFKPVDDFDFAEFEKPADPGTAKITHGILNKLFDGGKRQIVKTHAVKELSEVMGFGRSASYNALKTDGRFGAYLREEKGFLLWSTEPNLQKALSLPS
jgi:hypothetical protein